MSEIKSEANRLLPLLKLPKETGAAERDDGSPKKANRGIFLDEVYTPLGSYASPCGNLIEEIVSACRSIEPSPESSLNYFSDRGEFSALVSGYSDGDFYESHRDRARMTILLWATLHPFTGGDLVFDDFGITIPPIDGTGVIFPSHYRHSVKKVSCDKDKVARVCLTGFWV